ncbi:MAG TPA: carboxypeptidase-like regulatory domain-containing protein, partial [Chitinophagales bacterium]|nr:carboxypeptidase-like regulatory domain-containing protein [Chitinophagales bacterium]
MKIINNWVFAFVFVAFQYTGFAQEKQKIKIKVSDRTTGEMLYGANVQWLDTTIGATTDEYGIAELNVAGALPKKIIVSYIGYQDDTIEVHHQTEMNITLDPAIALEEVKIKGKRQTNFISSINPLKTEMIDAGELKKAACCNLSESFQTNASVDVNYSDAVTGAKEIKLLGLNGTYVQNLLEGIPVMRGVTATFGLDNIPAPWIKSISVSKGV